MENCMLAVNELWKKIVATYFNILPLLLLRSTERNTSSGCPGLDLNLEYAEYGAVM
jgi:hypothetical protein